MGGRLAKLSDPEILARWRSRLERAKNDFHEVAEGQQRFRQLTDIVRGNRRLQEVGGPFIDWIIRSHVYATCIAVRRDASGLSNDMSLDTLLDELSARADLLSRATYMAEWGPKDCDEQLMATHMFERFPIVAGVTGSDADHFDPAIISADKTELDRLTKAIVDWCNTYIAHRTERSVRDVTFDDLDLAIKGLQDVFGKYYAFLTLNSIATFTPVDMMNPLECFTFPWLVPDTNEP